MSLTIEQVLFRGPATSKEIQAATGMSQPGVSRALRAMGDAIITVKSGQSPRYLLVRRAFGSHDRLPIHMVDPHGNNTAIGVIRPLAFGGYFLQVLPGMPSVLLGVEKSGLFRGLPFFLRDLAPQGFIGRQIAMSLAGPSGFPSDPKDWSDEQIGQYLVSNGDDLPGNLKFGPQAHLRVRRRPTAHTPDDYPMLADQAMDGEVPGTSAGGEQPKFTAFCKDLAAHVIVKFSPRGSDPVARRWRDILITEFHASEAIHAVNYPAAETRLLERDGRLFLESRRFDRSGEYGRLSMISLQYVDAEFSGVGRGWPQAMRALHDLGLLSWQHLFDACVLWGFGRLIHNTDMHLGNLSLGIDGDVFRLLPIYDMGSMGFAPIAGELRAFDFHCPELEELVSGDPESNAAIKKAALAIARDFWNRVAGDERISPEFREYLALGNPVERATPKSGVS
ncbi:MAG: type II toxin-antitoxin system HipA family toxin YjjJ [Akkermansiaceae bacterium]|nr:type II toxin-antitoxin system HipA family toxin YjjJ [Akkermansiaceae bacterium]